MQTPSMDNPYTIKINLAHAAQRTDIATAKTDRFNLTWYRLKAYSSSHQ
jgi:hypothetical protein